MVCLIGNRHGVFPLRQTPATGLTRRNLMKAEADSDSQFVTAQDLATRR